MPSTPVRLQRRPPRLADTAFRVVETGQRVLLDRLDLARLDVLRLVSLGVRTAVAMAAATVLLSGAWCAIVVALALELQRGLGWSFAASLVAVALASAAAGAALIGRSLRRVGAFELSAIAPASEP
ncbi:hypothetical protein KF840_04515 [bacterium]|nr:hypothetical protein [bacterium]